MEWSAWNRDKIWNQLYNENGDSFLSHLVENGSLAMVLQFASNADSSLRSHIPYLLAGWDVRYARFSGRKFEKPKCTDKLEVQVGNMEITYFVYLGIVENQDRICLKICKSSLLNTRNTHSWNIIMPIWRTFFFGLAASVCVFVRYQQHNV